MITLHLKKDKVARGQRDKKNMRLNKIKFEVELDKLY